jgi:hypothetical protein
VRPAYEVADVLNTHWLEVVRCAQYNSWQLRTLDAIRRCRTASLGGHVDRCAECGHVRITYNSCRNRHCPKCQQIQRERWIQAREAELLPATYFHVVFTLPEALNRLCLYEPSKVYKLLFDTAWSVMRSFAGDKKHLGADTGMISILHTWGQNLSLHPHIHCIVPGGGITQAGRWKPARRHGKFLFPVKAMSSVFRARFVAVLRNTIMGLDKSFYNDLFKTAWVVYAKRPFGGPKQVIEYLGRYTHKIAISNHRITTITIDEVTFRYKDYKDESKNKIMTLPAAEFIRRFSLHILPKGFPRIRHYGILSSKRKQTTLPLIHDQLNSSYRKAEKKDWKQISADLGYHPDCCPLCKQKTMVTILVFDKRGPPDISLLKPIAKRQQENAATV